MTDNEKLIEDAAKAIIEVEYPEIAFGLLSEKRKEFRRRQARAALAVFEKAHAPTDNEWRRVAASEFIDVEKGDSYAHLVGRVKARPDPQGEPSDAMFREIEERVYAEYQGVNGVGVALVRAGYEAGVKAR